MKFIDKLKNKFKVKEIEDTPDGDGEMEEIDQTLIDQAERIDKIMRKLKDLDDGQLHITTGNCGQT